jgi:hypothetical protein
VSRATLAAFVVAAAAPFAAAAGAMTAATSLTVAPASVHRGHRVIIRGKPGGCVVGNAVTIISKAFAHTHDFAGLPAVFARVRSGGKFGTRPRIPSTKAAGNYGVSARCGGGNLGVSATIHVVA